MKWPIHRLRVYLQSMYGAKATIKLFHGIQEIVIKCLLAVQQAVIQDKHCFELYGYDVLVDEDLNPWLIEVLLINPLLFSLLPAGPCLIPLSSWTALTRYLISISISHSGDHMVMEDGHSTQEHAFKKKNALWPTALRSTVCSAHNLCAKARLFSPCHIESSVW